MHSPNDMVMLTKSFDKPWEASVPDDNFYPSAQEYSKTIRTALLLPESECLLLLCAWMTNKEL